MLRFSGNKAGMMNSITDKERIHRIIAENTSQNFETHEQKRAKRIEQRIQNNRQFLSQLSQGQLKSTENQLAEVIEALERDRSLKKVKVHIDMDAFFAAVECRDHPKLRNVPMAVGSDSMLSTSNYKARLFGVRSAMPGFIAKKLCPQLIIVPGSFSKYKRESHVIRTIFEHFDQNVVMGSLDEAYLDLTEFLGQRTTSVRCKRIRYTGECVCRLPLFNAGENELPMDAVERVTERCKKCGNERISLIDHIEFGSDVNSVVQQIRFQVEQETGLTCSAGIAANGMLSKICSDLNKPNGQFILENDRDKIIEFMRALPIRKVPGIGPATEAVLNALDVNTCGDLFKKRAVIRLLFPKLHSQWLLAISLGISGGGSNQDSSGGGDHDDEPKSTSIERTFTPTKDIAELLQIIRKLCERLIDSLPSSGILGASSATLKVKFSTFDVITRCKSVDFLIRTVETLYPIIEGLLKKELKEKQFGVRLLGVRLSNLKFYDENSAEDAQNSNERGGVQKSLYGFVQKMTNSTRTDNPIMIELDSDQEEADETTESRHLEEEEDLLNISMELEEQERFTQEITGSDELGQSGSDENQAENSTHDEEKEEKDAGDEEDVIFVGEVASDKPRQEHKLATKGNVKMKKPKGKTQRTRRSKTPIKPKGVKDLHHYFPTIL